MQLCEHLAGKPELASDARFTRQGPVSMALPDKARERASDAGYTVTPTLEEASAGPQTETPSFGTLVQAGLRGTRDDYEYSLHTFYKSPCFRQALLWGIGLGAAIALHRYKETSKPAGVRCQSTLLPHADPNPTTSNRCYPRGLIALQEVLCVQRTGLCSRGRLCRWAVGESGTKGKARRL